MCDVSFVNSTPIIAQNPKVTAINSCLEVDLTGQVVSDSIGTTMYSGNSVFNLGANKPKDFFLTFLSARIFTLSIELITKISWGSLAKCVRWLVAVALPAGVEHYTGENTKVVDSSHTPATLLVYLNDLCVFK